MINTWRGTKSLGTTGGSNLQACYQRGVSNDPEKEEKKGSKNRIKKTRAKEGLGGGVLIIRTEIQMIKHG